MRITIQAPNIELTPPLTEYIEEKIGGLEKFLKKFHPEDILVRVDVGRSTRHHRHGNVYHVDINLILPHGTIRAAYDDEDVRKAINAVRDMLKREIEKFKETHR